MKDRVKDKNIPAKNGKKKEKIEREERENLVKEIGDIIFKHIIDIKFILILDFIIFLLLFYFLPKIIFEVRPYVWMTLFVVSTILPTFLVYLKDMFKDYQVLIGIPLYYICIMSIIKFCTMKELYGITSLGTLDKTPAWVDVFFVVFIIVFFQYIGILLVKLMRMMKKTEK